MKEFVEKLIERLEEQAKLYRENEEIMQSHPCYQRGLYGFEALGFEKSIKIVNKLAEEYNHVSNDMMITELVEKLRTYANGYNTPPYGREIEGTKELLKEAADIIEELSAKENIRGFIKKIIEKLEDELYWADEEKRKADVLRFDRKVGYADGISSAIDIISQLAEIDKSNLSGNLTGWIPCSERLPDDFMSFEYLTIRKGHTLASITYYCVANHKWYSNRESTKDIEVIAWQPLPTYNLEEQKKIPTDHYEERFNRVM